jgi:hypothetical protein
MIRALIVTAVLAVPTVAAAGVLEAQPATDDVWAIVGPLEQRSEANLANNATFGMVVTPEGAVLMDPGGSWQGAEMPRSAPWPICRWSMSSTRAVRGLLFQLWTSMV